MNILELNLGVPNHVIDVTALTHRLPKLAAVLAHARLAKGVRLKLHDITEAGIFVYAAQLSVERTHVRLLKLQTLPAERAHLLQTLCHQWCQDLNLPFTFSSEALGNALAIGTLNTGTLNIGTLTTPLNLPSPAMFIEADIARSLHANNDPALEKQLRRLFNISHTHLHAHPINSGGVNSIWLGAKVPNDTLSTCFVQHGPSGWWDALPQWDAQASEQLQAALQQGPVTLKLCTAQVEMTLQLTKRQKLRWWQAPVQLNTILQEIQ